MPNHAYNRLFIAVKDYHKYVESKDVIVDFNTLIPEPSEITHTTSGTETDRAIVIYYSNKMQKPWSDVLKNLVDTGMFLEYTYNMCKNMDMNDPDVQKEVDRLYVLGESYAKLKDKYGSFTWYDWCYKNWGTKWNAYECEVEDMPDDDDAEAIIAFQTAWGHPVAWLRELANYCSFVCDTDIEGSDVHYRTICENGVLSFMHTEFVVDEEVEVNDNKTD